MLDDIKDILEDEDREYTKEDADRVMNAFNEMLQNNPTAVGSPLKIVNFKTLESTYAIAGMYLMTLNDPQNALDKMADKRDLHDDSYIWFEMRHVAECCQAIYASSTLLVSDGYIDTSTQNRIIQEIIEAAKPRQYSSFMYALRDILSKYNITIKPQETNRLKKQIINNFTSIVLSVWTVPYGKMDEVTKAFIQVMQDRENAEGGNNG